MSRTTENNIDRDALDGMYMSKQEAIDAMGRGEKVTHQHFSDNEWIMMDERSNIVDERGFRFSWHEFWQNRYDASFAFNWSIFREKSKFPLTEGFPSPLVPISEKISKNFKPVPFMVRLNKECPCCPGKTFEKCHYLLMSNGQKKKYHRRISKDYK